MPEQNRRSSVAAGKGPPPVFLNVVSTKRSGHHALISWLRKGWPGDTEFVNNAVINDALRQRIEAIGGSGKDDAGARAKTAIFNYEGVSAGGFARVRAWQAETGRPVRTLVFLRDPLNATASLLQRKAVAYLDIVMLLRQLFALRDWIKIARTHEARDVEVAFYNRWLADAACREAMASSFGLASSERTTAVEDYGGGSSFGDMAHVDDAAAAKLVRRWMSHKDQPLFRALVSHREFAEPFLALVRGNIADTFGGTDGDEARASFLSEVVTDRKPHAYADRMIDGLARNPRAFARIEAAGSAGKKPLIAAAHLRALAGL